ncbi:MAG: response regulator [Bacteroidota bacterium]|nr:response regulator [Bacteroidota bacterium]
MDRYKLNEKDKRKLKVLLAEDNIINQKIASINICKLGHEVEFANNGKIAIEKFQGAYYDIILMDLQMPIMGGIEATKKIREIEKSNIKRPIKIVAMTASAMPEDKHICFEAGMNDYISKPFRREDLSRVLNNYVSA